MTDLLARVLEGLLGLLRVPCGAFGGQLAAGSETFGPEGPVTARWCTKYLGHSDSCCYEHVPQPLWRFRRWAKGYR